MFCVKKMPDNLFGFIGRGVFCLICVLGFGFVNSINAQQNFKYLGTSVVPYEEISSPVEVYEIKSSQTEIDLKFEFQTYGKTTNAISVWEGYAGMYFDWKAPIHFYPFLATMSDLKFGVGELRVKRGVVNSMPYVELEFVNLEYEGYEGQTVTYKVRFSKTGEVSFHYGVNNLHPDHPLNQKSAIVVVDEEDYDAVMQNPGKEIYYSAVLLSELPEKPTVFEYKGEGSEEWVKYMDVFPPEGTMYSFAPEALGVGSVFNGKLSHAQKPIIVPNPSNGLVSVSFKGSAFDKVVITDIAGKVLVEKTQQLASEKVQLDCTPLQAGIYLLTVMNKGVAISAEKMIIR